MGKQYNNLFSPYQIGKLKIKNRFCVAPMGFFPYTASGALPDEAANYLVERAKGGFGLIFTGAINGDIEIDPYNPLDTASPLFHRGNYIRSFLYTNDRIHAYGAKSFCQITMGLGRNYPGLKSPSDVITWADPSQHAPVLTKDEMKRKIEQMIESAAVVKAAGFDGMEVHAMHWGYLLDQIAMSISNHRSDEYGGSLENRLRAAKEIVQGIKQVCGTDFPVVMRLGLKSYITGLGNNKSSLTGENEAGRTLEEGLEICKLLEVYGYDALNVDVGVYESFYQACPPMYMPKGHVIPVAAEAKKVVKIPILTASRMDDPEMCEFAIAEGKTDGVVLGRASLADPHYPRKIESGKEDSIRPCIACNQGCIFPAITGGAPTCAVNPAMSRELTYGIEKTMKAKKVIVVGGGVAGMEVARTATIRGHEVTLYEATDKLGGNLIPAGAHDFKNDVQRLNNWYQRELKDLAVPVYLNTQVTVDMLKEMEADAVVLAVGSAPVMPKIAGIDNAVTCVDAIMNGKEVGQNVVVVGGGLVGCEIALEYAMDGKKVTVVEAKDSILSAGDPVPVMNSMMLTDLMNKYNVAIRTGHKIEEVNDAGAVITSVEDGSESFISADTVIIAVGFKSMNSMAQDIYGTYLEIYEIGDGREVGNIKTSIGDAYEVARGL
ncbi:MAG: 2-enoate reductase [Clostridiales bacterium]|jgi:2-enoate reductase|nr:2-enoate reductase [Clostridiales bacterium]MDN5298774.1 2-enoate reductase [Clostridiales bacterium]